MENDKATVRTVFGKEIEVEKLVGVSASDIWGINPSLLAVEGGDPNYVYAWLIHDDPDTSRMLRSGLYEVVDPRNEPNLVAAGADKSDTTFRVNELVLARTPREKYEARKGAAKARAIHRELATEEQFKAAIRQASRALNPSETGSPTVRKSEQVKDEVEKW